MVLKVGQADVVENSGNQSSARKWRGLNLPAGLTVSVCENASRLISEYEKADWDGQTEGAKLTMEELILRLHRMLALAAPKSST